MGDHHDGNAVVLSQIGEQVEDVGANAHVEHRHRFVGHQHARLKDQRRRDHHALALTARQFECGSRPTNDSAGLQAGLL